MGGVRTNDNLLHDYCWLHHPDLNGEVNALVFTNRDRESHLECMRAGSDGEVVRYRHDAVGLFKEPLESPHPIVGNPAYHKAVCAVPLWRERTRHSGWNEVRRLWLQRVDGDSDSDGSTRVVRVQGW